MVMPELSQERGMSFDLNDVVKEEEEEARESSLLDNKCSTMKMQNDVVKEKKSMQLRLQLSREEIEEDFMSMTGRRPPRKPRRRPRPTFVQNLLDSLFPGLMLREVTPDLYDVPELPQSGKKNNRKRK
ncbi:uncharacterized protein LOC109794167, partial [Cajanus cajan]|uniref:uncharacterized protein LOC109794167 n=1 Tax=Cajanus cajan TaxID=3821 RepID=UPI00098D8158